MKLTIVLSKADLKKQPEISAQLLSCSALVREDESTCIYTPLTGKLGEFMGIVRRANLSYEFKLEKKSRS